MAVKSPCILIIFSLIIALTSCKNKAADPEPLLPSIASNNLLAEEGYVKATLTGNTNNGLSYSANMDFEGEYSPYDNTYEVINSTTTTISIRKNYMGQGSTFLNDKYGAIPYIAFSFNVASLNLLDSASLQGFTFYGTIEPTYNNYYLINCNWQPAINSGGVAYAPSNTTGTGTVSNLSYNSTTQVLTGNFTCNINGTHNTPSVVINNGSFSTKLLPQTN